MNSIIFFKYEDVILSNKSVATMQISLTVIKNKLTLSFSHCLSIRIMFRIFFMHFIKLYNTIKTRLFSLYTLLFFLFLFCYGYFHNEYEISKQIEIQFAASYLWIPFYLILIVKHIYLITYLTVLLTEL